MPDSEVDIAIRGAGPVGCALALALRDSGLSVRLIGRVARAPAPAPEASTARSAFRPLALSYASRLILERIGAWNTLAATTIEEIHISQAGGFGRTRISRNDLALPALGYVADYEDVATHLAGLVDPHLRVADDTNVPRARLVVHAEGTPEGQSTEKDYGHTAIVASLVSDRPPHGVAWERFAAEGPLALLPVKGGYGLVWSRTAFAATPLLNMGDHQFLAAVQAAFGRRAGRFIAAGPRTATPLALRYHSARAAEGEVRIGNAAQTLHPVAGQGLNLGLRDAWDLANLVSATPRAALGSLAFAGEFTRLRRMDAQSTIRATDLMATLFVRRDPIAAALRGLALTALDVFPPMRRQFTRRMIYGASAW